MKKVRVASVILAMLLLSLLGRAGHAATAEECRQYAENYFTVAVLRDQGVGKYDLFARIAELHVQDGLPPAHLATVALMLDRVYGNPSMSPERLRRGAQAECYAANNLTEL
jgi:hypothetical protein